MKVQAYHSIAIIRKIGDENSSPVNDFAAMVHEYAQKRNIVVFDNDVPVYERYVLFVSLGGDGTMLYSSKLSVKHYGSAVVGINLGNLGFLTEDIETLASKDHSLSYTEGLPVLHKKSLFAFLDAIMRHDLETVKRDRRMVLDITVGGEKHIAVNEVTLFASLQHFMSTTVAVNSMPVGKYNGNGVLVSTATGSTALGLSAGGAIISPNARVMQVVPILSHRVDKQPIITSGEDMVILRADVNERMNELFVLADSREIFRKEYTPGNSSFVDVMVTAHPVDVNIWRPVNWNFFYVLSQKMGKN